MTDLTEQQQKTIENYLEDRLQADERLSLEKWLEKTPSGRDYLQFLQKLKDISPGAARVEPPADLVDRIMNRVPSVRQTVPAFSWTKAGLGFACMVLIILGGVRWFYPPNRSTIKTNVDFTLNAPGARQVEIAGDFSSWKKVALRREDVYWKTQVMVSPGRDYQYVFILNNRVMVIDPSNEDVLRDKHGDFYSVLRLGEKTTKEDVNMTRTAYLKRGCSSLIAAMGFALVSPAFAETSPSLGFLNEIKTEVQSAGLNPKEIRKLLDKVQQLAAKGVPEKTLNEVVKESLSLGKDPALEKALNRANLLVSEGLAPADAGQVSLREIQAEVKAQDLEMEKSLEAGLEKNSKDLKKSKINGTQEEVEEKLEQKRQEWEDRMEKEKEIQSIQNQASGRKNSL